MELTLEQLMSGKATRIKDKEYYTTEAYVTPFLERISSLTDNFIINAKLADQVSITKENNVNFDDVIYNRVWIQGILPEEYAWDNHRKVISMLYALDTRKPLVKFYMGALNMACLNLCVFDPDALSVSELESEKAINYNPVNSIINMNDSVNEYLQKLSNTKYKRQNMFDELGHWIDNCINHKISNGFGSVKLTESFPINAYKELFYNKKSTYYTENDYVDGFTVYNAFTDLITQDTKDLVNKFEKTLLIKDILNI